MSAMSFFAMTVFTGWSLTTVTSVTDSPVSVAMPDSLRSSVVSTFCTTNSGRM